MFTAAQMVVAAYVAGAVGILIGAVIVATYRSDRRKRRTEDGRDIHPPTRLERILREDAAAKPLTTEQLRRRFGLDSRDIHDLFPEEER
jgi:hypothetical protein